MMRALMLCLICSWLAGCAVNPATGRNDFVMMSERQELELGARYNQEILKQYPRYEDAKLQAYIQRVGERVARSSHRNQLNYVFTLVDSPDVNAFALPGGLHLYPSWPARLSEFRGGAGCCTGSRSGSRHGPP